MPSHPPFEEGDWPHDKCSEPCLRRIAILESNERLGGRAMLEIGSSLREARRLRKVELVEVERATRIRVQQLEALEQERFENLPPDPYRRSFLREYADFLGLDADLYT